MVLALVVPCCLPLVLAAAATATGLSQAVPAVHTCKGSGAPW